MHPYALPFLLALIAGFNSESSTAETPAEALEVMAEADRMAERDLWPGFDPSAIPVAIYDGENTLLFRHPSPPAEFESLPGREGVWTHPGRHPSVTANSHAMIGEVATATLMPAGVGVSLRDRAGTLIHEAFHVFQQANHPTWQANEVDLFTYPVDDPRLLALRRMEAEALRQALTAGRPEQTACWGRTAMKLRQERFAAMSEQAAAYERGTEWNEGLANYVEARAKDLPDSAIFPEAAFAPEAVRLRGYVTGTAISRLLDRFSPAWRSQQQQDDSIPLDVLLSKALAGLERNDEGCEFSASARDRMEATAAEDVNALRSRRAEQRSSFLEQEGWKLVVEASDSVLFPQGFDPLNVGGLRQGEMLHTRWIKLGNQMGELEVIGHPALSTAAGEHPLFNGLRQLVVTGLPNQPLVVEINGVVTVQMEGIEAEFRGAAVERSGQTIIVRLASGQ